MAASHFDCRQWRYSDWMAAPSFVSENFCLIFNVIGQANRGHVFDFLMSYLQTTIVPFILFHRVRDSSGSVWHFTDKVEGPNMCL